MDAEIKETKAVEVQSLDETDEKQIPGSLKIKFSFVDKEHPVTVTFTAEEVHNFGSRCEYFLMLVRRKHTDPVDLTHVNLETFMKIVPYLKSGNLPLIGNTDDIGALESLVRLLVTSDEMIEHCTYSVEKLFHNNLTKLDQKLIQDERRLRELLFKNEEKDFRIHDKDFEFSKIAQDMKFEPSQDFNGKLNSFSEGDKDYIEILGTDYVNALKNHSHRSPKSKIQLNKTTGYAEFIESVPIKLNPVHLQTKTFKLNLIRACKLFDQLDWKNICVAGGSCWKLAHFGQFGEVHRRWAKPGRMFLSKETDPRYNVEDIDIFLITKNSEEATNKVHELLNHFKTKSKDCMFLRTPYFISVWDPESQVEVQIILRLYNSIAQVISGFDLDSCALAFDGEKLYCMPRFIRAVQFGYNLVDPERQSPSYAARLKKYARRGFKVAIPGLNPKRIISSSITNLDAIGLAKFLRKISYQNENCCHVQSEQFASGDDPYNERYTDERDMDLSDYMFGSYKIQMGELNTCATQMMVGYLYNLKHLYKQQQEQKNIDEQSCEQIDWNATKSAKPITRKHYQLI